MSETRSGQPRKRRGDGVQRRHEILDAARTLFARSGAERTTMRAIADEVGISVPSVYAHFPDKMSVYVAVAELAFGELDGMFATASAVRDPIERLRAMSKSYVRFGLRYPEAYEIAFAPNIEFRSGPVSPETQSSAGLAVDVGAQVFEAFRRAVSDTPGLARGSIAEDDALARVMWATGHGIVSLSRSKANAFPETPEAYVDVLIDAFLGAAAPGRRAHER